MPDIFAEFEFVTYTKLNNTFGLYALQADLLTLGDSVTGLSGSIAGQAASIAALQAAEASTALLPFIQSITVPAAVGLLSYLPPSTGGVARGLVGKLSDQMSVADFGAVGDGVADDTAAVQAAIVAAEAHARSLHLIGLTGCVFKITAPLTITGPLRLIGTGTAQSSLTAAGNFAAILSLTGACQQVWVEHLGLIQTGTTTRCVVAAPGAQGIKFFETSFTGNLSGILVYTQAAGFVEFQNCIWLCSAASTIGIVFDGYNQNCEISGGHAGGAGTFLIVQNSTGNVANNVQGLRICDFASVCTGPTAITISDQAFGTFLSNCVIDQAGTACVLIEAGAELTQIAGGYYGVTDTVHGICIQVAATAGAGTTIDDVQCFGGAQSIAVQASVSSRVTQVSIRNNSFSAAAACSLVLDSVNGCQVEGNLDMGSPSLGSWATSATNAAGAYTFGNNTWTAHTLSTVDPTSSYRATPDRGVTLAAKGQSTSGAGATSLVVNHGLLLTPSAINVTPIGSVGAFWLSAVGATSFTINWTTTGTFTWLWDAGVHD
jgi:hypothetical protein